MSDNYPERGKLDLEEILDQIDSFEPDEFYTNYFMTDEEYALRLQLDEYGQGFEAPSVSAPEEYGQGFEEPSVSAVEEYDQAFEEPSVSAVPTAARFSNIRDESPDESPSEEEVGTLRAIAGRVNRNYSNYMARSNPRARPYWDCTPCYDPSFTDAGNLWRQNNPHHSRLSGPQNLSLKASFYSRHPQMSPTPSPLRHEQMSSTMFRRSPEEREELERRRTKRKERDDDELYEGMRKSKVSQRGWNGERESDRQETIRGFHEAEDANTRAKIPKERAASGASRPQVMTERVSLRQLREGSERVQTRRTLEAMALEDMADGMMNEATSSMMSRHINMDELIGEAHGRSNAFQASSTNDRRPQGNWALNTDESRRRRLPQSVRAMDTAEGRRRSLPQGSRAINTAEEGIRAIQTAQGRRRSLPQGNGATERGRQISEVPERIQSPSLERSEQQNISSLGPEPIESPSPSPPTSPAIQPRGRQRIPSDAGSLKENGRERARPPLVRRPADQVRGFGNDITTWAEEDRKLQEAMAAAQEANAANRRGGRAAARRPANLPDQENFTANRRSANADNQEANAENQRLPSSQGSARRRGSGETETYEDSHGWTRSF